MCWKHGFKNRTGHQTVFFFNFRFNPGFCLVFDRFSGFWPFLGVLTGPDWLSVPGWTGRTGRSGPVFKTVTVRQMAVLMLWQSRGLANGTYCLFIVIVPILFMYHMLGTWLALGKLDSAPKAQMLVMCELNFI